MHIPKTLAECGDHHPTLNDLITFSISNYLLASYRALIKKTQRKNKTALGTELLRSSMGEIKGIYLMNKLVSTQV